jgi:hypothetical protein
MRGSSAATLKSEPGVRQMAIGLTVAEAVDTVLVLFAIFSLRRVIVPMPGAGGHRRAAWFMAVPLLALMLAANFGYHWALMNFAGVKPETDDLMMAGGCLRSSVCSRRSSRNFFFAGSRLIFSLRARHAARRRSHLP